MKTLANHRFPLMTLIFSLFATTQAFAIYTPQEALKDLLAENLTYVGKYIPKYSESQTIPVCIFRGKKVLVKYTYCVPYAIPAASVEIYSSDPKKGSLTVYAETGLNKDVSLVTRQDYFDVLWYNAAKIPDDTFDFNADLQAFKAYDEHEVGAPSFEGCVTASTLSDKPYQTYCSAEHASELDNYGPKGQAFWKSPDDSWYKTLILLKSKVPNQ